jgi:Flp pilus assembly protein TadG
MKRRSKRGNFIIDTPLALFIFLFFFCFPFMDLATITLRSTFMYAAAHNAAWEAARAHTYLTSLDGQPSAVQLASTSASRTAAAFSGIQVNSVKTNIVSTNINSLNQTKQSAPLKLPADSSVNSYQVEVSVSGAVSPLITYNAAGFTNIPGLTQPMIMTFTDRQYCENPQGLNK